MLLNINLKPTIVKGRTIGEVKSKINYRKLYTSSNHTENLVLTDGQNYYVYNIVKVKAKRLRAKDRHDKNVYVVAKQAEVTAYVYKFNVDLIKILGVKLKQNTRNFELVNIFSK